MGTRRIGNEAKEVGTLGLDAFSGWITEAYNRELYWPGVEPLYSRLYRSDPEVTVVRNFFQVLTAETPLTWRLPADETNDSPNDAENRALEFAHTIDEDVQGGLSSWLASSMRAVFYGFGWWEVPFGLRREGWAPPGGGDWRSAHNDNLVGVRKIAFRSYSSFESWEMDDRTGEVVGFKQNDPPNEPIMIPRNRSLHLTYGDHDNPEGLGMLESLWRLEDLMYKYQIIHAIGSERSAGFVKWKVNGTPTESDKNLMRRGARAIMSAQEGNYVVETDLLELALMDTPFTAADAVESMIRYLHTMKLMLFGMQWAALSSTTDRGSRAAMDGSTDMAVLLYNSTVSGFVRQFNDQVTKRLFEHPINARAFAGARRYPELYIPPVEKVPELAEFGSFLQAIKDVLPLGEKDHIAIRRATKILPEDPPEDADVITQPEEEMPDEIGRNRDETEEETPSQVEDEIGRNRDETSGADMARRPFVVSEDEQPIPLGEEGIITAQDIARATRKFLRWADENDPTLAALMRAEVVEEEESGDSS